MKNYRYCLYPTEEQVSKLMSWIAICRQQYNSALLDRQQHYRQYRKGLSRMQQQKQLAADKKQHPILHTVPSQPLQETLFRLEKAYQNFFSGRARYPRLKTERDYRSLTFTQFGTGTRRQKQKNGSFVERPVRYAASFDEKGQLCITQLGYISVDYHRPLIGRVKQVILKQEIDGRWYAIFSVEEPAQDKKPKSPSLETGIDRGLKVFAALSNGEMIENPRFLRKKEKQLARAQRRLSRKQKGSSNARKQRAWVQQLHAKVKHQRQDFLHKETTRLANIYGLNAIEELKVRSMIKNHRFAKSIADVGWGMFAQMLDYKTRDRGGMLVKVAPHYTSVNCSCCGHPVKKSLSTRTHICPKCGFIADRDTNAALNILQKAKDQLCIA
jgi:putative transposase